MRVIGIDNDGCLICQEGDDIWNCGETPEEFGIHLLFPEERKLLGLE